MRENTNAAAPIGDHPATHEIVLGIDTPESDAFANWLQARGHTAKLGYGAGSYVDGAWVRSDAGAAFILDRLWAEYSRD
ncbi:MULTISPECIES: hypothetical protein [unclassified Thioalkalivibrio]|uniref:hypothetical protein n=1 Tax=unclassified Thioalkalivibrio TaxID=2621013 RepID=UPI00037F2116|nr:MULTISPECIES: hypothetical protein [unclassified Thioalkalivibrio]